MSNVSAESTMPGSAESARARDRFPIYASMQFIPIDVSGDLVGSKAIRVFGKDLSSTGIAFSHDTRLPSRRGIIAINNAKVCRLFLEVQVLWSRLTPIGQYESGCRLVRKITPARPSTPVNADA